MRPGDPREPYAEKDGKVHSTGAKRENLEVSRTLAVLLLRGLLDKMPPWGRPRRNNDGLAQIPHLALRLDRFCTQVLYLGNIRNRCRRNSRFYRRSWTAHFPQR